MKNHNHPCLRYSHSLLLPIRLMPTTFQVTPRVFSNVPRTTLAKHSLIVHNANEPTASRPTLISTSTECRNSAALPSTTQSHHCHSICLHCQRTLISLQAISISHCFLNFFQCCLSFQLPWNTCHSIVESQRELDVSGKRESRGQWFEPNYLP